MKPQHGAWGLPVHALAVRLSGHVWQLPWSELGRSPCCPARAEVTSACRLMCLTLAMTWGPHAPLEHGSGGGGSPGTGVRSMRNLFLGLFGDGMDESRRCSQMTCIRRGSGRFSLALLLGGSLSVKELPPF